MRALTVRRDGSSSWNSLHAGLSSAFCRRTGRGHKQDLQTALGHLHKLRPKRPDMFIESAWAVFIFAKQCDPVVALQLLDECICCIPDVRSATVLGDAQKAKVAAGHAKLFEAAVYLSLELNMASRSFEYADASKLQNLRDALQCKARDAGDPWAGKLRARLRLEQNAHASISQGDIARMMDRLPDHPTASQVKAVCAPHGILVALKDVEAHESTTTGMSDSILPRTLEPAKWNARCCLPQTTCGLQWFIGRPGSEPIVFVFTNGMQEPRTYQYEGGSARRVKRSVEMFVLSRKRKALSHSIGGLLHNIAQSLQLEAVLALIPMHCTRLLLIPHRDLHLIPFHALPFGTGTVLDRYIVEYAPSMSLIHPAVADASTNPGASKSADASTKKLDLLAVQNPTRNLLHADREIDWVCQCFEPCKTLRLAHSDATREAVLSAMRAVAYNNIHFACHG
jgi:hypothetical protein